jgi:DNA-binding MarR family transcriptional regulator
LDPGEMAAVVEEFNGFYIRLPSIQRLSFTTLSVLHTLARRSPLRLGELTATEQVTQSAITQMVTRLENDGLVERRPDPRDGRAVLVHITPTGAEVVAARRANRVARLAPILQRLSAEERSAIAAALPALRRIAELGESQNEQRDEHDRLPPDANPYSRAR